LFGSGQGKAHPLLTELENLSFLRQVGNYWEVELIASIITQINIRKISIWLQNYSPVALTRNELNLAKNQKTSGARLANPQRSF
jgi:hypothetical protein